MSLNILNSILNSGLDFRSVVDKIEIQLFYLASSIDFCFEWHWRERDSFFWLQIFRESSSSTIYSPPLLQYFLNDPNFEILFPISGPAVYIGPRFSFYSSKWWPNYEFCFSINWSQLSLPWPRHIASATRSGDLLLIDNIWRIIGKLHAIERNTLFHSILPHKNSENTNTNRTSSKNLFTNQPP